MIIREARADDILRFSRYTIPQFIGLVAEEDGRFIGACVVVWRDKRPILCLELTQELRRRRVFLHRCAAVFIGTVAKSLDVLYTMESPAEPTANRWLRRLGFEDTGELLNGERLFQWRKSS